MPIYPFRCDACAVEFEVTRKASAAADPAACPACGVKARRIFTAIARTGPSAKSSASTPRGGAGAAAGSPGWSHFGHEHGSDNSGHSHGGAAPAAAAD